MCASALKKIREVGGGGEKVGLIWPDSDLKCKTEFLEADTGCLKRGMETQGASLMGWRHRVPQSWDGDTGCLTHGRDADKA